MRRHGQVHEGVGEADGRGAIEVLAEDDVYRLLEAPAGGELA